jgi:hypothetical protein
VFSEYPLVYDMWLETEIIYYRCWRGYQSHEGEPVYVHAPSKINGSDASTCSVVTNTGPTKVVYRPMPSSSTNFVGRADYLAKLEAVFVGGRNQTGSRPVGVLAGFGGLGKTQISVKFAETRSNL